MTQKMHTNGWTCLHLEGQPLMANKDMSGFRHH